MHVVKSLSLLKISKQVKAEVKHSKIQFETKLAENIKKTKKSSFLPILEVKQKQIHIQVRPLLSSEGKLVGLEDSQYNSYPQGWQQASG